MTDDRIGEIWRLPENYCKPLAFGRAIEAECRVPEGYVLVPVEPSDSQLDVAVSFALNVRICSDYNWSAYMRDVYARMIAAAPKPEKAEPDCECGAVASEHCPACEPVAQEPFGIWHQGDTEEESDFFLFKDAGDVSCPNCIKLYTAPPDQSAEAQREINMALDLDDARERIAELERQQAVLEEALEESQATMRQWRDYNFHPHCFPENFNRTQLALRKVTEALASVKGNAGNERTAD